MDKQNVIYTYNGILFSLEKEHATTWMNLEDIMLSEISQLQKDKCIIPFLLGTQTCKSIDRKQYGGCQGPEEGRNRKLFFSGYEISVWKGGKSSG